MIDSILQHQPQWRYCRVKQGEKRPYPNNWQNTPLTLDQVDSANIGLILGPASGGVCAIDFDGATAIDWLNKHIDVASVLNLSTPTWSSGKPGRCQMAFQVPEEIWSYLRTTQIKHRHDSIIAEGEGFEFRWQGAQSVLPPSIHPDTKSPYHWILPAIIPIADLPLSLLELWLKECDRPLKDANFSPEIKLDDLDDETIHDIDKILMAIKNRHILLGYEDWRNLVWATAHCVGRDAAPILLTKYYPEQRRGEYRRLLKTWNQSKSPTIGTLLFMAGLKKEPEISQSETGNTAARRFLQQQWKYKKML